MKCSCTQRDESVSPDQDLEGQTPCTNSGKTPTEPAKPEVPAWMWGIVAFILVNWQIMRTV